MTAPDRAPAVIIAARASAGTLLVLERRANREIQDAIEDAAARATAEAAASKREHRTEAALALLLLQTSRRLAAELTETIRRVRSRAREGAAARLAAELRAGGLRRSAANVTVSMLGHADDVRAATSADSLAVGWRARTLQDARRVSRGDGDVLEALATSDDALVSSALRTATTETVTAYEDGRRESGESLEETPRTPYRPAWGGDLEDAPGVLALDMWDAILDRRTCSTCAMFDGATTAVGKAFPDGFEPGYVHPRCRCLRTLVFQYRTALTQ